MLPLTQEALTNLITNFLFYFIIGSFGAFMKDLYETITKKNEKIRLGEVLIGGTSATFLCYGLQDSWLKGLSINLIVLITFVCGILGFEIFGNLTTISKFKQFIETVIEFKNRFKITYVDPNKPPSPPPSPPPSSGNGQDNIQINITEINETIREEEKK
jgi:sensor histidine kinase YesM